jgi:hypothetical protein
MFVILGANKWEVPILEGYSLSQSMNTSEVTLSEASIGGVSRRGRKMFNDSLAPVEFSFSTYARPYKATGSASGKSTTTANEHHAVEEVLWAMMAGADTYTANNAYPFSRSTAGSGTAVITPNGTTNTAISFAQSNVVQLGTGFDIVFELEEEDASGLITYTVDHAIINEATIDFDIEGIATISWSGMGSTITEGSSATTATIFEGRDSTSNFIQNKLTTLNVTSSGSDFGGMLDAYDKITLTGGSVTVSNNITFLTPSELHKINVPIGHVTGTRSVSGNFTCYLDNQAGGSADLFEDLAGSLVAGTTSPITNSMGLTITLGGASAPSLQISVAQANVQIPTHSFDDVVSVDVTFDGLGTQLDGTDEIALTYTGPAN